MIPPSEQPAIPRLPGVELAPGIRIPTESLRIQYARSSGPGGQNVNKVNTKTDIWVSIAAMMGLKDSARDRLTKLAGHRLTLAGEIHIAADNHRTQEANRAEAFERLRELLIQAMHEPKRRRKTKPSKAARQRRIDGKKRRSDVKTNRRYKTE